MIPNEIICKEKKNIRNTQKKYKNQTKIQFKSENSIFKLKKGDVRKHHPYSFCQDKITS